MMLTREGEQALERASRAEGLSRSELIRKGIRSATAAYRPRRGRLFGWLKLSKAEREEIFAEKRGARD